VGRSTFAILLAQDLSVAPILITVSVLAAVAQAGGSLDPAVLGRSLFTLVPAAIGLGLLVLLGRVVLRPMFRSVAQARKSAQGGELFVAASLLVVVVAGLAAQASGLSMSIGALVAGVLLAETEFRREVEVSIEPFKGLLLGVFFVGVGLGLDLGAVAANPVLLFGLALAITVVKTGIIFGLARLWGLAPKPALETALVLAPAGEFAFVVFATGMVEGIAPPGLTSTVALSATLSIFSIPLLAALGQRLSRPKTSGLPTTPEGTAPPEQADGAVIIVGFGRVGRLIGELLREHDQTFIALDTDAAAVAAGRRDGFDVFYGDAGRSEMLVHCGVRSTRALIVTMDAPAKVDEVVTTARALREDLILIARARDDQHAARLYGLGVTDAVPETTEASLQLAENTLVDLGVPMGRVLVSIHEKRDQFRKRFQEAIPAGGRDRATRALRASHFSTGN
jgi:CPA2 family monovalent cation:H+ antiporter-2